MKSLGITEVTEDGRIFKNEIELSQTAVTCKHQYGTDRKYKVISIYDPDYYLRQKVEDCKFKSGIRTLLVSRVAYA